MKMFLLLLFVGCSFGLSAQNNNLRHHIQVTAGLSKHGSGDMDGIQFGTDYTMYFTDRVTLVIGLGGTIHDGSIPIYYKNQLTNAYEDGSVRYTTAGMQFSNHIGYSFIKSSRHEAQCRAGILLRYQSSSLADLTGITYPAATGQPYPVVNFVHTSPQQTNAFGGSVQLQYNYTLNNNMTLGILGGYQLDTQGDNISQVALTVGKRF